MNKRMLLLFMAMVVFVTTYADGFLIQNYHGINCILHTVERDETFYGISQKFSVRPSTLAVVNNVTNVSAITAGKLIYIPLTETNFFTTIGINKSDDNFLPIFYKLPGTRSLEAVAKEFGVGVTNLANWNPNYTKGLDQGDRIIIGWIKYNAQLDTIAPPQFISEEAIVFGNTQERNNVTQLQLDNSIRKRKKAPRVFPDYTVPIDELSITKKSDYNAPQKRITRTYNQHAKETSKSLIKKNTGGTQVNADTKKSQQKVSSGDSPTKKLTEAEQAFLKNEEVVKSKNKKGVLGTLKSFTKNAYSREKEEDYVGAKKVIAQSTEKNINSKPILADAVYDKPDAENLSDNVINKMANTNTLTEVEQTETDGPIYIENNIQRLTLLKSIKGGGTFFYSGGAGGKYYVFTNLAKKGDVVKITNLENEQFVLAEVIGYLAEEDRALGYIIRMSDNSKKVLGIQSSSFSAKVNY